jgi:hypothetical protein
LPIERERAVLELLTSKVWKSASAIERAVATRPASRVQPGAKPRLGTRPAAKSNADALKRAVERVVARLAEERRIEQRVMLIRNHAVRMVRRRSRFNLRQADTTSGWA